MLDRLLQMFRANHILLWCCLITMTSQLGFGMVIPVLPFFVQTFGGTAAAIGVAVALYGLGRLLFDLPMGQLTDRVGRRRVILIGEVLTAVGSLGCALAPSYDVLLVFRFVAGVGSAAVLTCTQIVVADVSQPENRGRLMGVYMSFFQLAVGVGPVIGGLLADALGPRAPFFAFAMLGAMAAAVCLTRLPETRHLSRVSHAGVASGPSGLAILGRLLVLPGFILVGLIAFAATVARTGGIFTVVPATAYQASSLSPAEVGLAFTAANLCNLLCASGAGWLSDRFGRKATIAPGAILVGLAFVLFARQTSYPVFVISALGWGVGSSLYNSSGSAYAADLAPPGGYGATLGIYRTLGDAGYAIGPVVVGFLADRASPPGAMLAIAALLLAIVVPFVLFAPETRKKVTVGAA